MKFYADPIIQICIKMNPDDLRKSYPEDIFFEAGSGLKNHSGTRRFRAFVKLFFLVKDKDYWGYEQKIEVAALALQYIQLRLFHYLNFRKRNQPYLGRTDHLEKNTLTH